MECVLISYLRLNKEWCLKCMVFRVIVLAWVLAPRLISCTTLGT